MVFFQHWKNTNQMVQFMVKRTNEHKNNYNLTITQKFHHLKNYHLSSPKKSSSKSRWKQKFQFPEDLSTPNSYRLHFLLLSKHKEHPEKKSFISFHPHIIFFNIFRVVSSKFICFMSFGWVCLKKGELNTKKGNSRSLHALIEA